MPTWAWLGGTSRFGDPANHVLPVLFGIAGHLLNSMLVGVVFAAMMRMLGEPRPAITLGVAYAVGVWVLMRYLVLPANAGEGELFTRSIVSPQWVWWLAHVLLGVTLGTLYFLSRRSSRSRDGLSLQTAGPR